VTLSKEEVKELFRAREVKILIGTDAMSEGLNLQTCDQLINYDMPWNFMRVEQRIGRIDRIGGRPNVFVTNYFYRDTVEEQVYTGIAEDADWFRQVVGPAQPVLGHVEAVIEKLAMQSAGKGRDQSLQDELETVRQAIKDYQQKPVTLGTLEPGEVDDELALGSVFGLGEIEETLLRNPITKPLMHAHPDFDQTYLVEVDGDKHPMTFDRAVYEQNPEIGFMTYGHPVFDRLIRVGSEGRA
jgi:superfamily II DNA/RNA helicase